MRFTLVSDGSSDQALIPAIRWLLTEHGVGDGLDGAWADFRFRLKPPAGLKEKILLGIELYPCELLFVYRDAEAASLGDRKREIDEVVEEIEEEGTTVKPAVCVIPVRMMEAWLLVDETAIRRAAGNPGGRMSLGLPRVNRIESIPDAKNLLFNALATASGCTGRRLAKLNFPALRYRVAELVSDHGQLRNLSAFRALEAEVESALN